MRKNVNEKFMAYISALEEVMCEGIKGEYLKEMDPKDMVPWVYGNSKFLRL